MPPVAAMAMLGFVAATNRWVSWSDAVHRYHDGDPISYRAIAAAAPGLPHQPLAEWHAERFLPNYLVGCVAKLLHAGLIPTYRVVCVAVAVVICLALADLLGRLPLSMPGTLVCLGAFILNAYGLRYFFFGVGRIADLVFILGVVFAARGLVLHAPVSLLGGLLLATAARQTAVPAALTAAVVVAVDPAWRRQLGRFKSAFAVAVAGGPLAAYGAIRIVAAPFSGPAPSLHTMTVLGAGTANALIDHFARSAIALLSLTALLAAAFLIARRRPVVRGNVAAAYGCLLFAVSIAVQPFVLSPAWASDSEPRLAVLGLAPLVVALALFLAALEQARGAKLGAGAAAALVGTLAIGSFHHIFTVIGPISKAYTGVLQVGVALAAGALLLWNGRRGGAVPPPDGSSLPGRRRAIRGAKFIAGVLALAVLAVARSPAPASAFSKAVWGPLYHNRVNQFPMYKRLGVSIYEADLYWSSVARRRPRKPADPADPAYRWPADLAKAIAQADRFHIRVLLQVIQTPRWANGGKAPNWAPRSAADYAAFVTAAARHYRGVHLWMIWGEPTRAPNFQPLTPAVPLTRLSPAQQRAPHVYSRLLDVAYGALKRISPANIVIGGCTYTTGDISTQQWIENLRLPSGRVPRMDMYAHNPFSWQEPNFSDPPSPDGVVQFSDLPRLAGWIDRYLHRPLPLFLSEWTIPTHVDPQFNFYVDPPVAAKWIRHALALTRGWRRVYALGWINVYDSPPTTYGGLLTSSGTPKPSYYAFAS